MSEEIFIVLSMSLAVGVAAIFIKLVLLCHEAREEEFVARKKAVALAELNRESGADPR